jgi:hypothetical protein
MAFVRRLLVGVVVHLRHNEPSAVRLAVENAQRVVVPNFNLAAAYQLLTLDLQMGVNKEHLGSQHTETRFRRSL